MQITSLFPRGPGPRPRDDDAVPDGQAIAAVQVLNQQSIAAARTNDAEWFSRNLADDAVVVLGGGHRQRKPEFLELLQNGPMLYRSLAVQDVTVRAFGSMVQVDAVASCELAEGTSCVSRYIATWVRLAGRWQVVAAQVTPLAE
jgi:hypothetical protein